MFGKFLITLEDRFMMLGFSPYDSKIIVNDLKIDV